MIVLVEPQSPGNIGMTCRAMKNMGLSQLRIVKGCDRFDSESLKFAVAARDLLESAHIYPDLASAIADCTLTVGTTRRHGKYRQEILSPPEVAGLFREQVSAECRGALVFGREDNGLTTEELSLCRWHATIPTSHEYGSLNLSQSVLLFCYELGKATEPVGGGRPLELAKSDEMETLFAHLDSTLNKIGFLNEQNPAHMMRSLRRIFFRANLDSREVTVLRGMLTQIDWASSAFDGRKRS
ncbi:MAG: RNA methyltransferase [Desulfuromonadaceae bacterium]|nr:RNA methyltransferase [Desulfuromonadaceae bacterium]